MKLKEGFVLHTAGGENMMVATGKASKAFNGLVRNNDTAQFILQQLLEDTTEDAIVEKMCKEYDAPAEVIREGVQKLVSQLNEAGFLE